MIHFQTTQPKTKENGLIMEKATAFVADVYKLVNEFIINCGFNEHVLSNFRVKYKYINNEMQRT